MLKRVVLCNKEYRLTFIGVESSKVVCVRFLDQPNWSIKTSTVIIIHDKLMLLRETVGLVLERLR